MVPSTSEELLCNTRSSLTRGTSATAYEAGVDTWKLLFTPADHRSVDAAIDFTRGRRTVVANHMIGYVAEHQVIWLEGHPASKNRLARGAELPQAANCLRESLAAIGIRTIGPARVSRLDATVTQRFAEPLEGCAVLTGMARLDVPRCKPVVRGRPVETVELMNKNRGRRILARSYDWGLHRNAERRGTIVRMESQDRFPRDQQSSAEDLAPGFARKRFRRRFESIWQASKGITVAGLPIIANTVIERLRRGEISAAQCERALGYLMTERAGVAEERYSRASLYRRRAEVRELGLVLADDFMEPVSVDISAVIEQALETEHWGDD
jgi:hypothetical protein